MADTSSGSPGSSRRRPGSSAPKPKPSSGEKSSSMGFLGKKIGPVPIWLIGLGIFGVYYWYTHYGPGAQKKTTAKQGQSRGRGRGGGTRVIVIRDGKGKGRRHNHKNKQSPRANAAPAGGNVGGGMTAEATAPYQTGAAAPGPTGGAVDDTGAPVYAAYQQFYGAQGGDGDSAAVPDPVQAYAPMTAGAIYAGPDYG